jgi:hypothetical protein
MAILMAQSTQLNNRAEILLMANKHGDSKPQFGMITITYSPAFFLVTTCRRTNSKGTMMTD